MNQTTNTAASIDLAQLDKLEALARAATPQNLDSAEDATKPQGFIECPECGGEGTVELTADYCNYDGKAMGVQFYGIGPEHQAAEAFFRAANPATVQQLIALARHSLTSGAPASKTIDHDAFWVLVAACRDAKPGQDYQEQSRKLVAYVNGWANRSAAHVHDAAAPSAEQALREALRRLCTHEKRTSAQINADWDHARAVLALLNHIEDVVDDANWEKIDPALWNAVTKPASDAAAPSAEQARTNHDIADRLSLWLSSSLDDHLRQDEYRKHIRAWLEFDGNGAALSAGAAAKTDHAGCWSDAVPCNKCGAIGWHNCCPSTTAAGAGSAQPADPWHDAVLAECMRIESAYNAAHPVATIKALIDWHVQEASGVAEGIKIMADNYMKLTCGAQPAALDERALYEAWELQEAEHTKGEPLTHDEVQYVLKRWTRDRDTYERCPHHWPAFKAGVRAALTQQAGAAAPSREDAALDIATLWDIHGVVKDAGSTRLAHKISDHVAALALARAPLPAHPGQDGEKDAMRKDAERWRFIVKDGQSLMGRFTLVRADDNGNIDELHGGLYDEAIDKAMAAAQQDAKGEQP